jgi:hypothetical protein
MKVGDYVFDWALGRSGIIVDGPWIEPAFTDSEAAHDSHKDIPWEWAILFDGGDLAGGDTRDLKVIKNGDR